MHLPLTEFSQRPGLNDGIPSRKRTHVRVSERHVTIDDEIGCIRKMKDWKYQSLQTREQRTRSNMSRKAKMVVTMSGSRDSMVVGVSRRFFLIWSLLGGEGPLFAAAVAAKLCCCLLIV